MRLFLDTEFTDFMHMDLISIGLVSEDGLHEFYAEISDYDTDSASDFVKQIVLPLLVGGAVPYEQAGHNMLTWMETLNSLKIEVIVDYTGDATLMSELLRAHHHEQQISYRFHNEVLQELAIGQTFQDASDTWLYDVGSNLISRALRVAEQTHDNYFNTTDKQIHNALTDARALQLGFVAGVAALKYVPK
jgi:hypothetical protein